MAYFKKVFNIIAAIIHMPQITAITQIFSLDIVIFFRIFDQFLIEFSLKQVLTVSIKNWSSKL